MNNDIYIGDFENINVYVNKYGITLIYFGRNYSYLYSGDLKTQLNSIRSLAGNLILFGSGFWGVAYYENNTTFNLDKFREFIFNNECLKDILLLEDILE